MKITTGTQRKDSDRLIADLEARLPKRRWEIYFGIVISEYGQKGYAIVECNEGEYLPSYDELQNLVNTHIIKGIRS